MYNIIRWILSLIVTFGMTAYVRKSKWKREKWAYRICGIAGVVLWFVLGFIPVENIIGPIKSIESVYKYRNPKAEIRLIIEGEESAYVSGVEDGSEMIMVVPRAKGGWYVGTGAEHETVARGSSNNIVYHVYQYKDTTDYYVNVYDRHGKELEIQDAYDSQYILLEKNEEYKYDFPEYYAYVPEYDENYWISVNGEKIEFRSIE